MRLLKGNLLSLSGLFTGAVASGGGVGIVHLVNNRADLFSRISSKITKESGFNKVFAEYIKQDGERNSTTCQIWMTRGDIEWGHQTTKDLLDIECKKLINEMWGNDSQNHPSVWLRVTKEQLNNIASHHHLLLEDDEYKGENIQEKWELNNKSLKCSKNEIKEGSDKGKIIISCFPLSKVK